MRVGVFYFPTDYGINIAEPARAPVERGFASRYGYRVAGIDEALLEIPDQSQDEILQLLDRYQPLTAI